MKEQQQRWIVGVTGSSGTRYTMRLLDQLAKIGADIHIVFSDAALRVLKDEEGVVISHSRLSSKLLIGRNYEAMHFYNPRDIGALIASGSFRVNGMVLCPCSMGTLGAVAHGLSENLVQRAADVTIKEGRRLIIVPRETPLSAIHLENMLKLARLGVCICPAMPGFYHKPKTIDDIVDMQVMKIMDQMGIHVDLVPRWGEEGKKKKAPKRK